MDKDDENAVIYYMRTDMSGDINKEDRWTGNYLTTRKEYNQHVKTFTGCRSEDFQYFMYELHVNIKV